MWTERTCERCGGQELLIATEKGVVVGWRDKSGRHADWFCPRCDWGNAPHHPRKA